MVTHDPSAATFADRVVFLADGRIAGIEDRRHRRDPRPPAAHAMIAVALRSMAQRKLRSALTAVAILLGVAMIAGTYVQTDQIRAAFDDILQTANSGVDANIAPRTEFRSDFAEQTLDESIVARASRVPGVDRAEGQLFQTGSLVVDGEAVEPRFAPAILVSNSGPPFNPLRVVSGGCRRGAARSSSTASSPRTSAWRSAPAWA